MRRYLLVGLVVAGLALPSCRGRLLEDREDLLKAVSKTELLAREFTYQEVTEGKTVAVIGKIEDALRYSFTLIEDDFGVMEMVVSDDTLAVRLLDPNKVTTLPLLPDPSIAPTVDALRRGEWVVDPSGAPPLDLGLSEEEQGRLGADPVRDALKVFSYISVAVEEAQAAKEWQEDDVDPAYVGSEDPFPDPEEALGVARYDLVRPLLPRREPQGAGPGLDFQPTNRYFRKMAVYVRDNRVVEVLEDIDFESHLELSRAEEEGKPRFLLDLLAALRTGETQERIRVRRMRLELNNLGRAISVEVPQGLTASLAGLFGPAEEEEAGQELPAGEQPEPVAPGGEGASPTP